MLLDRERLTAESLRAERYPGFEEFALELVSSALSDTSALDDIDYEVRTRGSVANATDIEGSDLDFLVLARHEMKFDKSAEYPTAPDKPDSGFDCWRDLSHRVYGSLSDSFESRLTHVEQANKCIKISGHPDFPAIDVVPALDRKTRYLDLEYGIVKYADGIEFWTQDNDPQRILYTASRHTPLVQGMDEQTDGRFRQAVRALKVARNILEDEKLIEPDIVSSHDIESLLFNLPVDAYDSGLGHTIDEAVAKFTEQDPSQLIAISQGAQLVGRGVLQWHPEDASTFIKAVAVNS